MAGSNSNRSSKPSYALSDEAATRSQRLVQPSLQSADTVERQDTSRKFASRGSINNSMR